LKSAGWQVMNHPKKEIMRKGEEEIGRNAKGSKNGRKKDVQKERGKKTAKNKAQKDNAK
jgi:hypothetical protein